MLRYAITDRHRLPSNSLGAPLIPRTSRDEWEEDALIAQATHLAARGDIDYLQLREKNLPPATLATLARRILEVLRVSTPVAPPFSDPARRLRLLINSRADVAIAVRADGVHLTSSPGELTPAQVRSLYAEAGLPTPIVSISCHTIADVVAARGPRAGFGSGDELCFAPDPATAPDLILFGPVFEKTVAAPASQPDASGPRETRIAEGSGLEALRQACTVAAPIPVLALGGITEQNTAACVTVGAAGIAAIRLFLQ